MGLEMAWGLFGLLLLSALDLRLFTFMLALPMLNPDGIGNGLGFVWSVAAFRPRLTPFHLHAGSTNVESRWDWKWLGVCLVCCFFPPSTYDFRLQNNRYHRPFSLHRLQL
ncbi:MAG: hypothetical protein R2828_07445 [Saprospiraceae bacterium]